MMLMWIVPIVLIALLFDRPNRKASWAPWLLVIAALVALPSLGMWGMGGSMWGMGHGMHGYAPSGWIWVEGVLLVVAVGVVAWYLTRRRDNPESEELQILRLRLARGEISPEDYDLLRQKLSS